MRGVGGRVEEQREWRLVVVVAPVVVEVVGGPAECGRGWNDLHELVVDGVRVCERLELGWMSGGTTILASTDGSQEMSWYRCSY